VIFSKSFKEHLQHLDLVFKVFDNMHVMLKPSKSFFAYPSITLLRQQVDSLGMSTTVNKIKALLDIDFSTNLKDLEMYLGLTGWLRQYILYYI
jgi:hypothetical protein